MSNHRQLGPSSRSTGCVQRTIQPRAGDSGDEELRSIGVLAGVGHGQQVRLGVAEVEVLVGKLFQVGRGSMRQPLRIDPTADRPSQADSPSLRR